MADGDGTNLKLKQIAAKKKEEQRSEELIETLAELNNSVCNISKLLQQLQRNIARERMHEVAPASARTLH